MPIGALVGGQLGGFLMSRWSTCSSNQQSFTHFTSRLGRKGTMMVAAVLFAFSYFTLVVAPNVWVVYIGRLA